MPNIMAAQRPLRYHVAFLQVLDATGTFSKTINVPFIPDEMKVKQISFSGPGGVGAWSLQCDSLAGAGNSSLGFFTDPCISFTGLTFTIGRNIDGLHQFRIMDPSGVATGLAAMWLYVHLEFRKY